MNQAKCTTCGAGLTFKQGDKTCVCAYCQSTNIVENALALGKVEVDVTEDIKKLRSNLTTFVQQNSIDEILRVSQKLLDWIPQDFVALYFFGYAKQQQNQPKFLYTFLETPLPHTIEEWQSVKLHLFEHSELRDKQRVLQFLKLVDQSATSDFLAIYDKRQVAEEHYANVPRDVFVCFSSWNQNIAHDVMEVVESDGYTCWISTRNLRPNDAENYWINIENAIEKASLFIVIGSEESMRSKDVQKEIELAIKHNKKRFEIKIDSAKQTSFFKFAFDGIKWLEYDSIQLSKLLKKRVFEEIQLNSTIKATETVSKVEPKSTDQKKKHINKFAFLSLVFITVAAIGVFLLSQTVNQPSTTLDGTNTPIEEVQIQEDLESVGGEAIDTTPPTLTLIGDERVILSYGSEYIELGFNVEDDIDETVKVIVSGDIDSKSPGQYEILYTATDQSGNSTVVTRFVIVEELVERIINVYAGGNNSYAVTNTNRIFSWGKNLDGNVGDGSNTNRNQAVEITSNFLLGDVDFSLKGLKTIQSGDDYAVALFEDGTLFYWGNRINSHCRHTIATDQSNLPVPLRLVNSDGVEYSFKEISIKDQSIYPFAPISRSFVGITMEDEIILFGNLNYLHSMFKPGNYRCTDYVQPVNISETFVREANLDEFEIVSYQVQVGYALTKNGSLYSWGINELASYDSQGTELSRVPVMFSHENLPDPGQINSLLPLFPDEKIQTIKSGNSSSAFLTDRGRVFIAGINLCDDRNSTNFGRSELVILNGLVSMNLNESFVYIAHGDDFGFAVTNQNRVFSWGCNSFGQIGNDTRIFSYKNRIIEEITDFLDLEIDESIDKISAGNGHVIALTSNGRVFVWGSNSHGQLGTGNNQISIIPVEITEIIIPST